MRMRMRRLSALVAAGAVLGMASGVAAYAREPAVPAADMQEAEFAGLSVLPGGEGAAVGLRIGEDRVVPIFIGPVEAAAIARAESGIRPARPETHELVVAILQATGAGLERLAIDDLREGVYFAAVELRLAGGERIWIDARPSDGIALALRHGAPILLAPAIIEAAQKWPRTERPPGPGEIIRTGHGGRGGTLFQKRSTNSSAAPASRASTSASLRTRSAPSALSTRISSA